MGVHLIDCYSLLHIATGIVAYFWGIPLEWWFLLHALFEVVENSPYGVYAIDTYITLWPGGKKKPDTLLNSVGDQTCAVLGWVLAYIVKSFC
jgi:hypothetical protein